MGIFLRHSYNIPQSCWGSFVDVKYAIKTNAERIFGINADDIVLSIPLWDGHGDFTTNYFAQVETPLTLVNTKWVTQNLYFDGSSSYINVNDGGALSGFYFLTVLASVQWDGTVRAEEETVIGNWASVATNRGFLFRWDSQTSRMEVYVAKSGGILNSVNSYTNTDISDKKVHNLALVYNGSHVIVSKDGKASPTVSTLAGTLETVTGDVYIGEDRYPIVGSRDYFDGFLRNINIFKSPIDQSQVSLFNSLPHALYQKVYRPFYLIPSLTQYKLSADAGSFQTTGANADLLKDSIIAADASSFNIIGQDVTLTYIQGYILIAGSGAYTLTVDVLDLLYGYRLDAESGSFEISGQNVLLLKDSKLLAESGIYSITGQLISLIKGFLLGLESGTYSLTGQIIDLNKSSKIIIRSGSYVVTGNESGLLRGYPLTANNGAYGLTGNPIDLLHKYIVDASSGEYNILGDEANLLRGHRIYAESESFGITGKGINLIVGLKIDIDSGIYDIAGQNIILTYNGIIYIDGCLKMVFISNQPTVTFADISNQPNIVFADISNQPNIVFADLC